MTLQQFLLILRARARIAFYVFFGTVFVVVVGSLLWPKSYTASTAIVLDVKSPDPVAGVLLPGLMSPGYMATQVDIINSDRVARRVVRLLRLHESPVIKEQWQEATEGRGDMVAWLALLLQRKVDVKPARDSNVIDINFTGADPGFAAAIANAFAKAYIDVNLELKVEPAKQYADWFDEQVRQYRDKLEKAQSELSAYQQRTGIVATDERLDYETAKLNDLSTQLTIVQGQTTDSASKQKSAGGSETLTEVMQSPLINQLKADLARLEAKRDEVSVSLGKNHPQVRRMESEIATLVENIAAETRKISTSIGTSVVVGKQKEKELLEAIQTQKTKVLELNKQRDEIAVLQRDVETAQRAYEAVSQRSSQTRLESQSAQTNVAILNPAVEPLEPSRPRLLLNIIVSIFLGIVLGVGVALALELGNRRVRSAEDIVEALDLPVLASIASTLPPPTLWQTIKSFFKFRRRPAAA